MPDIMVKEATNIRKVLYVRVEKSVLDNKIM